MLHVWKLMLDILFPPGTDEQLIATETLDSFKKKRESGTVMTSIIALSSFKDPAIRAAIHLVKFHNHTHAAKLLAALVHDYLYMYVQKESILIPIPLSSKRLRQRGHNQVQTIIKAHKHTNPLVHIRTDLLIKTKHTSPQSALSRAERNVNASGVFALCPHAHDVLAGKHVLILDDVVTTGNTLYEAMKTIQKAKPASIVGIAIAH